MKSKCIIILLLLIQNIYCQDTILSCPSRNKHQNEKHFSRKNILWFNPSRANEINGVAISKEISTVKSDSLKINGLNIGIEPKWLLAGPYVLIVAFASPFIIGASSNNTSNNFFYPDSEKVEVKLNGISLGILGSPFVSSAINGLTLNTIGGGGQKLNGIAISGMSNWFYRINGLSIAGLMNSTTKGNVIQIGLLNYCQECNGLQIGLWNKMGKRGLPFINLNYKRREHKK